MPSRVVSEQDNPDARSLGTAPCEMSLSSMQLLVFLSLTDSFCPGGLVPAMHRGPGGGQESAKPSAIPLPALSSPG